MKLSIGDTVIYRQPRDDLPVNGTSEHPAIITRVWSDTCVNLSVTFDGGGTQFMHSVSELPPDLPQASFNFNRNGGWRAKVRS